jgi:hypothetical protein
VDNLIGSMPGAGKTRRWARMTRPHRKSAVNPRPKMSLRSRCPRSLRPDRRCVASSFALLSA